jgi:DNA-binding NtrC family response regulator
MAEIEQDGAEWLRSPLHEKQFRLQPMRELTVKPYFGPRRRWQIFRTRIEIGRHADCEIRIDDPFISQRHAELRLAEGGGGYFVHDLGSRNGTFLNGVRVTTAPLLSQGTLRLGRSTIFWSDSLPADDPAGEGWVVADPSMRTLVQTLRRVALSSLPVLLLGETGTGKDVLARLLHQGGAAAKGPFVPLNGALTGGTLAESELFGHRKGAFTGADSARQGAIRSAHGGTLFLDEVADVPPPAQVKLLRALETGEVKPLGSDQAERADFRLVCATSRDLYKRVRDGQFRQDLYYRIAGFVVQVPPLRERPLDVLAIARKLAAERELDLDSEAESRLLSYRWPGNVRELRSTVERAAVLARADGAGRILSAHVQGLDLAAPDQEIFSSYRPTLVEQERKFVLGALERNGWARGVTARELGIARSSLLGKMRKFGLRTEATEQSGSG